MFDRAKLAEAGGFDPQVYRSEDYELFLRLARRHPIAGHPGLVAQYRIHDANLSARYGEMAASALAAQKRHRPDDSDEAGQRAYALGKRTAMRAYAVSAWRSDARGPGARKWENRLDMARLAPLSSLGAALWQFARRHLPPAATDRIKALLGRGAPGLGKVQMGDLARKRPISWHFGYDRGTPIDRYYIENFLARNAADIHGRVLEIGDDTYSRRFGSGVVRQDVLHIDAKAPGATITGDLSQTGLLPNGAFDCMILTQTLHLIFDVAASVRELHRGLKPGGVLLVTLPGVASVDRGEFADTWYWSMTAKSVGRLFGDVFGADNIAISVHGNVYAATCFLQGLALEEINQGWLDDFDASYPMIVTVRARRAV
jgi:SAM-dependent methyltransferase